MLDYDKVPWRGVHEYLLEVESARNVQDFFARALAGIERLIPFDLASTLFDGAGRMLASKGFGEASIRIFNDYYRFRIPFLPDPYADLRRYLAISEKFQIVEWSDYGDSEFVADYARPQRNAHTIAHIDPGLPVIVSLHRSSRCSTFTDADCATLAILNLHLSNLYCCLEKLAQTVHHAFYEDKIRELFPQVSRREAQVATLLCRGLTAPEIASKLFLSVRTAEWHIEQLYMKIDARNKREAITRLTNECED